MKNTHITLICGGIGSGKSVVCRILRTLGYSVYDTDSEARRIMDTSPRIVEAIGRDVCPAAVKNGRIDRAVLGQAVFNDKTLLERLNSIVHGAVRADIAEYALAHAGQHIFIETAIPNSGGLCGIVDDVWQVTAPEGVRIERVMKRNGFDAEHIKARIEAQKADAVPCHERVTTIVNDNVTPLLPQIFISLR